MICTLTARRLTPDSCDAFRSAWDPGEAPTGWRRIYHCRDVSDPDVVISFGLFDGTLENCVRRNSAYAAATRSTASTRTSKRCCSMDPTKSSKNSARDPRE